MMVTRIIMFLITTTTAEQHQGRTISTLNQNDTFFGKVYVAIHTVVDNLFETIELPPKFSKELNTKLLLTMHKDLGNIARHTFEIFKEIEKIIKVNVTHSINNQTNEKEKLDTIVHDTLNENNYNLYDIVKAVRHRPDKVKTKAIVIPGLDDSKEFTKLVTKFLVKVNNFTDFKNPSKYVRYAVPSKQNIKAWVAPSDLEPNRMNTRRIFRGLKTTVSSYPFIVSIHVMGEFTCSGSIIRKDVIITSASCLRIAYKSDFFEKNLKSIYVRLSSDHTTRGGETIPAEELHFHPEYEPMNLLNNLAIIRLEKRIRYVRQLKRHRRILWDRTPGNILNDTKSILVVGWGATKTKQVNQHHPKLKVGMLDLYNIDECSQKYKKDSITNKNFCGAYNGTIGAACNGDSGGPGIVGAVLMGVVSFGAEECGEAGKPTVFTKLGYYAPWIQSVLNLHKTKNKTNDKIKINDLNLTATTLKYPRRFINKEQDKQLLRDAMKKILTANQSSGTRGLLQKTLRRAIRLKNISE